MGACWHVMPFLLDTVIVAIVSSLLRLRYHHHCRRAYSSCCLIPLSYFCVHNHFHWEWRVLCFRLCRWTIDWQHNSIGNIMCVCQMMIGTQQLKQNKRRKNKDSMAHSKSFRTYIYSIHIYIYIYYLHVLDSKRAISILCIHTHIDKYILTMWEETNQHSAWNHLH